MDKFPFYSQLDMMDCGSACLRMIAKYYGNSYSLEMLRSHSFISREGVSMLGISDAAEYLGMHTLGVKITFEQLANEAVLPCILHWNQNHFVVCYGIRGNKTDWPRSQQMRYELVYAQAQNKAYFVYM